MSAQKFAFLRQDLQQELIMHFHVFTAVKFHIAVFLGRTLCSLVTCFQRFGGIYCHRLQETAHSSEKLARI
jgi:hypothetical protein